MAMGEIPGFFADSRPADDIVLSYGEAGLTWRELDSRSNRRAHFYRSLGVGQGDNVAIALGNGIAFHEAVFAVWKLGATPATLSPRLSTGEFEGLIALLEPRLLISDAAGIAELGLVRTVRGDADMTGFGDAPVAAPPAPIWKLSSSGGSTGRPKIVVHASSARFDPESSGIRNEFLLEPGDVVLNPGPLYHNAPFLFSNYALFTGGSVVGMSRFDPEEALRLIEQYRVNWVNLVPTMMHRIWSLPEEVRTRYDLSSLKTVWHMASACPKWLKEAWIDWLGEERIWERYGGTEGFGSTVIGGADWLTHKGSVGRVINGADLKIVDEEGQRCAPGDIGEIFFRPPAGKAVARYIGAELSGDADGYYSMGDLGHVDEDGFLFLADRRTDLIIRGGANIYPAEIEAALDRHPAVASSIVIGLPDDEFGARVHAIAEAKPGATIDVASLHAFLKDNLVPYKLPESYEIVAEPLRDEAGKARRSALREERLRWVAGSRPFREMPAKGA